MATSISIYCRFSDGTFASLVNNSVTENTTTEIQTGGTGLAQVSGVSVGQAFVGKTMTHAVAKVSTEDATTGQLCFAQLIGPDGKIAMIIQGGGNHVGEFPALCRPVVMVTGMRAEARFDASADSATLTASLAVYCTDGTADVFFASAVDSTKTALLNKDGATIGQALSTKTIMKAYATYGGTYGINESQDGNGAFYVESSEGQLKAMYPPGKPGSNLSYFQIYPVRINQNDTLSVMSDIS
jgi:hypothetical protein